MKIKSTLAFVVALLGAIISAQANAAAVPYQTFARFDVYVGNTMQTFKGSSSNPSYPNWIVVVSLTDQPSVKRMRVVVSKADAAVIANMVKMTYIKGASIRVVTIGGSVHLTLKDASISSVNENEPGGGVGFDLAYGAEASP